MAQALMVACRPPPETTVSPPPATPGLDCRGLTRQPCRNRCPEPPPVLASRHPRPTWRPQWGRPARSDNRLRMPIATLSLHVLRRLLEFTQYAARAYRRLLEEHGMLCSMSRKGDCWDNAPMESFFGSMKTELKMAPYSKHGRSPRAPCSLSSRASTIANACTRRSATAPRSKRNRSPRPRRS